MEHSQVIIRPVVSEKSYVLSASTATPSASMTKRTRRRSARPSRRCSTCTSSRCGRRRVKSKPKRRGTTSGRTRTWKKAIVQVRDGESIPIFQGLAALEA